MDAFGPETDVARRAVGELSYMGRGYASDFSGHNTLADCQKAAAKKGRRFLPVCCMACGACHFRSRLRGQRHLGAGSCQCGDWHWRGRFCDSRADVVSETDYKALSAMLGGILRKNR